MLKLNLKNNKAIIIVTALVLIVIAIVFHEKKEVQEEHAQLSPEEYTQERVKLREMLETTGPEKTFLAIKQEFIDKKLTEEECHALLHGVGHYAYEYYNKDLSRASQLIDSTCYYAYFHGIESQIILDETNYIPILKGLCKSVRSNDPNVYCFHGAGHTFMEETGNVLESLKKCDEFEKYPNSDLDNCYGGVFSELGNEAMGFDTDVGIQTETAPKIEFHYEHPLEFCNTLKTQYQASCARQLVKLKYNYNDPENSFKECFLKSITPDMTEVCVNVSGTFYAEDKWFKGSPIHVPKAILEAQKNIQINFLVGVKTALKDNGEKNTAKVYSAICNEFLNKNDKDNCVEVFGYK